MRYFHPIRLMFATVLLSLGVTAASSAQDWESRRLFEGRDSVQVLRLLSSTDTSFFVPIVEGFLTRNPHLSVDYMVTSTADLDKVFRRNPSHYDVVISSAMDLQLKLANDGYAHRVTGIAQPPWAQWRQNLFAFTSEPAAIVINRAAFKGRRKPQTRQDLILALRTRPDIFKDRIGTYDIRTSGLGYLFATQDARVSETYWRLMEVMGSLDTKLYCCSGEMIDDLATGDIAVAYNVLGSYANARADVADKIEVILPSDFPTTMMRTAFVSKQSQRPLAAIDFVKYLLAEQKSQPSAQAFQLPPLRSSTAGTQQSTIPLDTSLLTYLDSLKRHKFIEAWESAIIQ